jgi:hypothetical protein
MLEYLRELTTARLVLWSYFAWYVGVAVQHFDPSAALWANAIGISVIMGTAYYLSARAGKHAARPDRWHVFRMFLMPFCVSSFAALVKGQGFVLVFYPTLRENLIALLPIGSLCTIVLAVKRWVPRAQAGAGDLKLPEISVNPHIASSCCAISRFAFGSSGLRPLLRRYHTSARSV